MALPGGVHLELHSRLQPSTTSAALMQPVQVICESPNQMPQAAANNSFADNRGIQGDVLL